MPSQCKTAVDSSGRELQQHGSPEFPVACYYDDFRLIDVPWHWHQEWEAVLLTEGSCTVAAGNRKANLVAGEGFFIPSEILHGCWDLEDSGCKFHSLVFHPQLVGGSPDSIFHQNYVQPLMHLSSPELVVLKPDVPWQKEALEAIEAAWQAVAEDLPDYPLEVRSALSRLTALLRRNLPASSLSPSARQQRHGERIKAMLSLIHRDFGNDLTISMIAASASVSESECLRCFRSAIGTTPIQYLKQYRIRQAAAQLRSTADKVSDIAGRCGFQDMSYFTRAFRRQMGCVPSQYRKTDAP